MIYVVELPIDDGDDFTERMNSMRAWLDHRKVQPSAFRFSSAGPAVCRVHFRSESEAEAFARQFGGQSLAIPAAAAAGGGNG